MLAHAKPSANVCRNRCAMRPSLPSYGTTQQPSAAWHSYC